MNKKQNNLFAIPSMVEAVVQSVVSFIFFLNVYKLDILPKGYLMALAAALILLIAACGAACAFARSRTQFTIRLIFPILLCVVLIIGACFIQKSLDVFDDISDSKTETVEVHVYVRSEDPSTAISDVSDDVFGILRELDRKSVDQVITKIQSELGKTIQIKEFDRFIELADALLDGKISVIIMSNSYVEALAGMEGYSDIGQRIRTLSEYVSQIEITVPPTTVPPTTQTTTTKPDSPIPTEPKPEAPIFVAYISGIDSRNGLVKKSNSDVNILVVVNAVTKKILLLTTPRDYYIPLPISNGIPDKLTHAGIYGVNVSIETLEMLYDIDIDYYFRLDFSGFEKIIDALGGVSVYSEYEFTAYHTDENDKNPHFVKGINYLNGEQALLFARERYAFAAGDHQRGKNQMAVIRGVIDKVLSPSILLNFNSLLDSVKGCFETSVPMEVISDLVRNQLSNSGQWEIQSFNVTGYNDTQIPYSMNFEVYVMQPDMASVEKGKDLINQVLSGQ